ncbi:helix-turn-helix domain-containing protein [Pseudomonas sp. NPDC089554]|uniref:helix-turn-helix domain-containing protein n=1 Tax=Pseudomonas sp. NPDC089554 TaxID=3390653 RepID=UPI003D045A81
MSLARIPAVHRDKTIPLYGSNPIGSLSPAAMPVETHHLEPGAWHSHRLDAQMLTMFLQPSELLHSEGSQPVRKIPVAARSIAFSLRAREESVCWLKPVRMVSVCVRDEVLQNAAEEFGGGPFELLPDPGVRDERLSALMHALHVEQVGGFGSGRLFVDAIEQAIASSLVSRYNAFAPTKLRPVVGLPPYCAKRVVDFIHSHLDQPLTLAELAECAGFSRAHFSRLFHATFSTTPHHYVMNARIELAKSMLLVTRNSILEIALSCGFQTSQHFSRNFRNATGVTPNDFRKQYN